MCVICVSPRGAAQPTARTISNMFTNNSHGAGYMVARHGRVEIHKGYAELSEYMRAIQDEKFTEDDVVIYHCRIATQARRYEMTQPFPLEEEGELLTAWDCWSDFGIAHNGIISRTSNGNPLLSDTALYIRDYLFPRIKNEADIKADLSKIETETSGSRIAILCGNGDYYLTGRWIYEHGMLFSNDSYQDYTWRNYTYGGVKSYIKAAHSGGGAK